MFYDGGGVGTPDFLSFPPPHKSEGEREKLWPEKWERSRLEGRTCFECQWQHGGCILMDNDPHVSSKETQSAGSALLAVLFAPQPCEVGQDEG